MITQLKQYGIDRRLHFQDKVFENIIFYNSKGIQAKSRGYIETYNFDSHYKTRKNVKTVLLLFELKLKRKVSFDIKNGFYVSKNGENTLYLNTKDLDFQNIGERLEFETKTEKVFYSYFSVKLSAYFADNTKPDKLILYQENSSRNELKPYGKKIKKIADNLKELQIDISSYDLEKLMEHYRVIKIKKVSK